MPSGSFPPDCKSHLTSGETSLSSHTGWPAHLSGSWLHYVARQAGIKEPMLLRRVIITRLHRAHPAWCCCWRAPRGTGERVAASHKSHQQPCPVPWKPKPLFPRSCEFALGDATQAASQRQLLFQCVLSQSDPGGFINVLWRFVWESISAGWAVHSFQFPHGWTKLASFRWVWRNTTDFTSPEVFQCNSTHLWDPQIPLQRSTSPPYICKQNFFLIFPEILLRYLTEISWLFLRTWPAAFPPGSLLTITSSVHIQLDALQRSAFQWLPNNVH